MNIFQAIKEKIIFLASMNGREMSPAMLNGYYEAISDLEPNATLKALTDWSKASRGFPFPADIREKVKPEINPEDDAQDMANLIIASVTKFGYTNPSLAKAHIGSLGWETVTRMGGWKHLCETLTPANESVYRAQIRDYAQTVRRKAIRGELDKKPELPQASNVYQLIGKTMKGIE